jgi:hypothetical protein
MDGIAGIDVLKEKTPRFEKTWEKGSFHNCSNPHRFGRCCACWSCHRGLELN